MRCMRGRYSWARSTLCVVASRKSALRRRRYSQRSMRGCWMQARWRGAGGAGGFSTIRGSGAGGGGPMGLLRNGKHPASTEDSRSRVACVRIRRDTASGLPPEAARCHGACAEGVVRQPAPGGFGRAPDRGSRLCAGGPPSGPHGDCAPGCPSRDGHRQSLDAVSFPWQGDRRYRPGSGEEPGVMRCPSCAYENLADSRFCAQCGVPLGRDPARVPDLRAYTPRHLAEKILSHRSALHGERKQVTVFFADVKGSMELAEQVDPEAWHRIMDRFFQLLAEGVHRFEGTVNQYTGDGIMALFGAPIAHEDHAQRACWAALHLQESLRAYADELRRTRGLNFSVRTGLNSGDVVVGTIGDDLRMDYPRRATRWGW